MGHDRDRRGLGSVIGVVGLRLRLRHPMGLAVPIVALFALRSIALALRAPIAVLAVRSLFGGMAFVSFSLLFETMVQRHIPAELLSRVIAYDWFGSAPFPSASPSPPRLHRRSA